MTRDEYGRTAEKHRSYLVNFVTKKLGDRRDAEDIVGQAFSELARPDKYGPITVRGARAWFQVAVNYRIQTWKRKRAKSPEVGDTLKLDERQEKLEETGLDSHAVLIDEALERALDVRRRPRLGDIQPDIRRAMLMREERVPVPWAEIAKEHGINMKTLQSRVRRHQGRLRKEAQLAEEKAGKKRAAPARKPEPAPTWVIEDHLWHPDLLKIAKYLREGGTLKSSFEPSTKTTIEWPQDVNKQIQSALRTGDIERIVQLLRKDPYAITHGVIFRQMLHLQKLVRMVDVEGVRELEEMGAGWDGPVLPTETKKAAREALQRLVSAWVRGVLPGHTVERVKSPKRRGRKRKMSEWEAEDSLMEFNDLYDELKKYPSTSFSPNVGETQESLIARTAELVQELHMKSHYSHESYVDPNHPKYDPSDKWNLFATFTKQEPLPPEVAMQVARRAVQKRDVRKHDLVYGLLAHHWNWSFDRVRHLVERAKLEFPELARRR